MGRPDALRVLSGCILAAGLSVGFAAKAQPRAQALTYRTAVHDVQLPANPSVHVEWSYPVFVAGAGWNPSALNSWLRSESLRFLNSCVSDGFESIAQLTDVQIVDRLRADPAFVDCGITQAVVSPVSAFEDIVMFNVNTESVGSVRSHHGVFALVYDVRANAAIDTSRLFKPDALESFNAVLADTLERERPACRGRSFTWDQVTFRPPDELFIEFPFNPAEWEACGDGVEAIRGAEVAEQLRRPHNAGSERELVRLR